MDGVHVLGLEWHNREVHRVVKMAALMNIVDLLFVFNEKQTVRIKVTAAYMHALQCLLMAVVKSLHSTQLEAIAVGFRLKINKLHY